MSNSGDFTLVEFFLLLNWSIDIIYYLAMIGQFFFFWGGGGGGGEVAHVHVYNKLSLYL